MKNLLIEEMKRAIALLESKDEVCTMKLTCGVYGDYASVDRETSEIKQLLLAVRKHSVQFEKQIPL